MLAQLAFTSAGVGERARRPQPAPGNCQVLAAFHKNRPMIAGQTPVTFFCVAFSQSKKYA